MFIKLLVAHLIYWANLLGRKQFGILGILYNVRWDCVVVVCTQCWFLYRESKQHLP